MRYETSNRTIVIVPADKGKGTVVLNKTDYEKKMEEIFDDPAHFVKLQHDLTIKTERSLVDLKKKRRIDGPTYRHLFSSDASISRAYGLPNVHKPECPLRPIVSFIGSPTHNLSKFLVQLITPVTEKSGLTVRNSSEFVELTRELTMDHDDVMVSFDAVSLFTNVPTDVAIAVAQARLRHDDTLPARTSLSIEDIVVLLRFCLNQTHFAFRGQVYHQIAGCPMGSPVSVTMANLVMEHLEMTALQRTRHKIKFYRRYVDDTFVIFNREHVNNFLSTLNDVEPGIQFTYEVEQDNRLPFLDVDVRRCQNGKLETSIHRKSRDTGNFLNFDSHHPIEHKRSVVRSLLRRSDNFTSTPELRAEEEATITMSLAKRGYPKQFIVNTKKRMQEEKRPLNKRDFNQITVCIPYVKGVSESVRRALLPLDIKTTFKPFIKLRSMLSKPKYPVPSASQSGVVYRVQCQDCDAVYTGETGRKCCTRLKENKRDVDYATHATRSKTELVDHCWRTGHTFDFANAETLAREQRCWPKKLPESWHIRGNPLACNVNRGPLPEIYVDLLK
ncbi:uncharacterized protein LOC135391440 [Ornithodoros turicata]|uniref:uncharacterized protein LOC135391440 n=1 Tax=Ornithodoros turicata TaxID=34597 RepID=UPI003138677A